MNKGISLAGSAYQPKKESADCAIKCIRNTTGQLKYDTQSINSSLLDFYTQLFTSENLSD